MEVLIRITAWSTVLRRCGVKDETTVETIVCWNCKGIEPFQGFLGGAGFRPSTVSLDPLMHMGMCFSLPKFLD